jgi:glycosyltransferase involved in cell wall biosynthesis
MDLQYVETERSIVAPRALKVLRISHSGSVTAYRERERQLIANFPVEVKLIIPERWQHLGGDNSEITENFEIAKARTYGTGNIPLFAYEIPLIARYLKEFRPDLVDIHEEPYSVSCFQVMQLVNRILPSAACVFYSAQNIKKRYPLPFSWTERYVYRHSVGAYPCSTGVKDVLLAKGFSTNSDVIPLGVDPEMFQLKKVDRSIHKLRDEAIVIGYFGRLEECKGLDFVFRALAQLGKESDWQVLVVGNGNHSDQLHQLASSLGIADRIVWIGEISASVIPDYINLCDATVVPSVTTATWKEQFGRAVTESMACGVPVISSDSGSLPEVVGDAGLIVPEQNVSALTEALKKFMQLPEYRMELREKSLRRVQAEYTWKRVAELTFDFYQRALQFKAQRLN